MFSRLPRVLLSNKRALAQSVFSRPFSLPAAPGGTLGVDMPQPKKSGVAKLVLPDGKELELPVLEAAIGPASLDIRHLQPKTGLTTYDPGYTSTASCHSAITYIDGDKGILLHRGYPIEQLAEKSDFFDVSYLLWYGELPNHEQRQTHIRHIKQHTMVHEKLLQFYRGFRDDAHPMAIMCGCVGALSAFYHDSTNINDPLHRSITYYRLLAKMPTIAAIAYKTAKGQPVMYPRNDLGYGENFLHMMFGVPTENRTIDPVLSRAMEVIMILHMDHEQNASTSTVRLAGSSGANPFAAISAGIATLWGPAHGGANEAVLKMLKEIGHVDNIPQFIQRAKDPKDGFRLMGFGHRVYKNYDPRAKIMRVMTMQVLDAMGVHEEPDLKIALALEKLALEDEYFIKRKLYPNIDFYSGICLRAMGIPVEMFTVLFAVSRVVGWMCHWNEMISDKSQKIGRPRQLYLGHTTRDYTALYERS